MVSVHRLQPAHSHEHVVDRRNVTVVLQCLLSRPSDPLLDRLRHALSRHRLVSPRAQRFCATVVPGAAESYSWSHSAARRMWNGDRGKQR